jgi:hypothetical protein
MGVRFPLPAPLQRMHNPFKYNNSLCDPTSLPRLASTSLGLVGYKMRYSAHLPYFQEDCSFPAFSDSQNFSGFGSITLNYGMRSG